MFLHQKIKIIVLSLLLFIPGCGLWNNFTTYFNLYYNASDLFEQAEKQIKEQEKGLFSTVDLTLPGTANTQLVKVVEKCSEILQFHSESDYVDDALLILGKSFYYQKNYQKALRKFQELLVAQGEDGDLLLETNLWIGKTQMKLRNFEQGLTMLADVRTTASEAGEDEILKEAFVEEIIYRITEEDYPLAIALSEQLLEQIDEEEIKAEVLYETGKLYNKINESEKAIAAFEEVLNYILPYEIELNAKLELGKTLRNLGRKEEALDVFDDMKSEAKFSENYNEIDLQTGITLKELGRIEEAVEKLKYVDTAYVNTPASGIAKYKLGEIYEYDLMNFDSAGSYYQKSFSTALPNEYGISASQKIRTFKKYNYLKDQINKFSSQLFYAENPELYTQDSIKFVVDSAAYVRDSLEVLEELILFSEHMQSLAGFDTTSILIDSALVKDSLAFNDSLLNDSTTALDSARIDSIKQKQRELAIKTEIAKRGLDIDSLFSEKWDPERKFPVKPVKPKITADSLKTILAKNEIEMGNLFLTEMELFDSAYYYYNHVLTFYPYTSQRANALYAMGSYYLNTNEKDKADSLFNFIYENFQNESIVNAAANQINKPLIDLDYDPAKQVYQQAEFELLSENYEEALNSFYSIFLQYPKSPVAPKALFASGWILENEMNLADSAAVIYDSLAIKYPQSEYTVKIRPKLNLYKQHLAELEKAKQDSLNNIDRPFDMISSDSTGIAVDSAGITQPDDVKPFDPDAQTEDLKKVESPDIDEKGDKSRDAILNNPIRNPRRK